MLCTKQFTCLNNSTFPCRVYICIYVYSELLAFAMSAVTQQNRRRRPLKMYILSSDHKVQDHLDGTIRLQRGNLCLEQEGGGERGIRGDYVWVKVRDAKYSSFINFHRSKNMRKRTCPNPTISNFFAGYRQRHYGEA